MLCSPFGGCACFVLSEIEPEEEMQPIPINQPDPPFVCLLLTAKSSLQTRRSSEMFAGVFPKKCSLYYQVTSPRLGGEQRKQIRLLPPDPKVTPANVSGGGGSRSELVITWEVSFPPPQWRRSQMSLFSEYRGPPFH